MKRFKPKIHLGDNIKFLKSLSADSIDLSIHDPAYESLEKHRHGAASCIRKMSTEDGWFPTFPNRRYLKWLTQLARVHKDNSHIYVFCDEETMDVIKSLGVRDSKNDLWFHTKHGKLRYWKALVWNKVLRGMGYHYRATKEYILFLEKGKRKLNDLGVSDVLTFKAVRSKSKYPTEKPVELLEQLILQSSNPGEVVLDTFLGSGSTVVAAYLTGRRSIGVDLAKKSLKHVRRNLKAAKQSVTKSKCDATARASLYLTGRSKLLPVKNSR